MHLGSTNTQGLPRRSINTQHQGDYQDSFFFFRNEEQVVFPPNKSFLRIEGTNIKLEPIYL